MNDLYATFQTDTTLEQEGKWFAFVGVKNADGTEPQFLMARMSSTNPAYQAAIEKHSKNLRQAMDLDTLTEDVAGPVMKGVFVDTILLDWRDVKDPKGNPLNYSKANATKLVADVPNLYLALVEEARKLSNFRAAAIEQVAGEYQPPSDPLSDSENT